MCGKTPKAPPPVVQRDPVAEQRQAEAEAQQKANAETAAVRRRRGMSGAIQTMAQRAGRLGGGAGDAPRTLLRQATPEG